MLHAVCAYWLETDLWLADVRRLKPWFPNNFPYVPSFTPQALAMFEGMPERMKPEHKREPADEWHELTRQDHVVRIYHMFLFYRLELMARRGLVEFQRDQYGDFRHDKIRKP